MEANILYQVQPFHCTGYQHFYSHPTYRIWLCISQKSLYLTYIKNPTYLNNQTPRYMHTTVVHHRIDCHVHQVDYWHYGFIDTTVISPLLTSDPLTCAPRHKSWCLVHSQFKRLMGRVFDTAFTWCGWLCILIKQSNTATNRASQARQPFAEEPEKLCHTAKIRISTSAGWSQPF
jgi:hypothetical protein